jgi:hypothetical protein
MKAQRPQPVTSSEQQEDLHSQPRRMTSPARQVPPLSLGDKACIYDWLRDAAMAEASADSVLRLFRAAAERAVDADDFDEILLKAMTAEACVPRPCTNDERDDHRSGINEHPI